MNFLNHCYVDTEVEMKEIYASNHMWTIFEKSFLPDMNRVADQVAAGITVGNLPPITVNVTRTKSHRLLVKYVCDALVTVIGSFFGSPFSTTAAAAAAAASTSSTDHHQMQTRADNGTSNSTSAVIDVAASTTNTNIVVHVSLNVIHFLVIG